MRHFMKNLFQNKISIKEVNQIENYVLEKLNFYDKNFINDKKITKIVGLNFAKNGISITREILNNLAVSYTHLDVYKRQTTSSKKQKFWRL